MESKSVDEKQGRVYIHCIENDDRENRLSLLGVALGGEREEKGSAAAPKFLKERRCK